MGCSSEPSLKVTPKMINEEFIGHRQVPLNVANKFSKSICKITFTNNEDQKSYETGFFMIYESLKC